VIDWPRQQIIKTKSARYGYKFRVGEGPRSIPKGQKYSFHAFLTSDLNVSGHWASKRCRFFASIFVRIGAAIDRGPAEAEVYVSIW